MTPKVEHNRSEKKRVLGRDGSVHHVLLLLTFLLIAVQPLPSAWGERFSEVVYAFVLIGCLAAVYERRRLFWIGLIPGVPALVLNFFESGGIVGGSGLVLGIVTLCFVCVVLLIKIYEEPVTTAANVSSALTVYLLLGVIWSLQFFLLETRAPGSFYGLAEGAFDTTRRELFYYSFVTLTTLGYGDIGPVSPTARASALMEAVVGQLYLVVLVASLVGMFLNDRGQTPEDA